MAKIFLSYRFTGEDPAHLQEVLGRLQSILQTGGHEVFCSFFLEQHFRDNGMDDDAIYAYCLGEQKNCDIFLALVKSEHPSNGMKWESQKAIELGQRYVLLIKEGLDFHHFRSAAHQVLDYRSLDDLYTLLETVSFS